MQNGIEKQYNTKRHLIMVSVLIKYKTPKWDYAIPIQKFS